MPDSSDADQELATRRAAWLIGLAPLGTTITGAFALVVAVFAFLSGRWEAAGVCLLAASVAFGALVNAVLRR